MCNCYADDIRRDIARREADARADAVLAEFYRREGQERCRCPKCGGEVWAVVAPWHACSNCSTQDQVVLMEVK